MTESLANVTYWKLTVLTARCKSTKGIQGNSLAGLLDPDRTRIFQSCGPVPKRRGPATKMEMTLESVPSGYFQMATARAAPTSLFPPRLYRTRFSNFHNLQGHERLTRLTDLVIDLCPASQ